MPMPCSSRGTGPIEHTDVPFNSCKCSIALIFPFALLKLRIPTPFHRGEGPSAHADTQTRAHVKVSVVLLPDAWFRGAYRACLHFVRGLSQSAGRQRLRQTRADVKVSIVHRRCAGKAAISGRGPGRRRAGGGGGGGVRAQAGGRVRRPQDGPHEGFRPGKE